MPGRLISWSSSPRASLDGGGLLLALLRRLLQGEAARLRAVGQVHAQQRAALALQGDDGHRARAPACSPRRSNSVAVCVASTRSTPSSGVAAACWACAQGAVEEAHHEGGAPLAGPGAGLLQPGRVRGAHHAHLARPARAAPSPRRAPARAGPAPGGSPAPRASSSSPERAHRRGPCASWPRRAPAPCAPPGAPAPPRSWAPRRGCRRHPRRGRAGRPCAPPSPGTPRARCRRACSRCSRRGPGSRACPRRRRGWLPGLRLRGAVPSGAATGSAGRASLREHPASAASRAIR